MIVKIEKAVVFEDGLDSLLIVLEKIIEDAQSAIELTKKAKEEKKLTDKEYERLLKLIDANETKKFVSNRLVTEMFHLLKLE